MRLWLADSVFASDCGRKKKKPLFFPVKFQMKVDSIRVEGNASDEISPEVTVDIDGAPVTLSGSSFDETVDMADRRSFTLEASDEAGNKDSVTFEVE